MWQDDLGGAFPVVEVPDALKRAADELTAQLSAGLSSETFMQAGVLCPRR